LAELQKMKDGITFYKKQAFIKKASDGSFFYEELCWLFDSIQS